MSDRFFRCSACGLQHPLGTTVCPRVGVSIDPGASLLPGAGGGPFMPEPIPLVARSRPSSRPPPPVPMPPEAPRPRRSDLPPPSLVGQTIEGRYAVHGVLASGGMGIVYDGVHIGLGRRVAIKALARRFADDIVAVTRFRNEARIAGSLGHPNIVEVFDLGALADGSPFLVMERLEGETLGDCLKRDVTMPALEALRVARQILSALAATHERNIIHRDLKPANVFLARHAGLPSTVKLLDFGISKNVQPAREMVNPQLTRVGFVMGTPTYMAPEQARGERDLDGRADLYAVGALTYEMLTGRPPYQAKTPTALMSEMRSKPPPRMRTLGIRVPLVLESAVFKLLALDRRQRFASAADALSALSGPSAERADGSDEDLTVRTAAPPFDEMGNDDHVEIFARRDKPRS